MNKVNSKKNIKSKEDFFHTYAALSPDAPSYVTRKADNELLAAVIRHEICLILAPRQSGKSSLAMHAISQLNNQKLYPNLYATGYIDYTQLGTNNSQKSAEGWFRDLILIIGKKLEIESETKAWLKDNDSMGPTLKFASYLKELLLQKIRKNIIIFFDEIETVLKLSFSDDFFATIRSIYIERSESTDNIELSRLTFVFLGTTTASDLIKDKTRTPFNIGREIQLTDFTKESIAPYKQVLGEDSDDLIERVFYWTNGQPWMVQKLAKAVFDIQQKKLKQNKINQLTIDKEVSENFLNQRIENDTHLKFIQDYLSQDEDKKKFRKTLQLYQKILKGKKISEDKDSPIQTRLKLSGVVRVENDQLVPRNKIYENIFNLKWVRKKTPLDLSRILLSLTTVISLSFVLWLQFIQPEFFPRFMNSNFVKSQLASPDSLIYLKYVQDPADYNIHVPRADFDEIHFDNKKQPIINDEPIEISLSPQTGESNHELKLIGGFFSKERKIPVKIIYYENWKIWESVGTDTLRNGKIKRKDDVKIYDAAFSSDEEYIITSDSDDELVLWNAKSGQQLKRFKGHTRDIWGVDFHPNSKWVISASDDRTIRLWDINSGEEIKVFPKIHRGPINCIAFSPDGNQVISGSNDKNLILWSIENEDISYVILGDESTNHKGGIKGVDFSPDGKWVISSGYDNNIKIWNVFKRELHQTLKDSPLFSSHEGTIRGISFSPDSKMIVSSSYDLKVKVWISESNNIFHLKNVYPSFHTNNIKDLDISPKSNAGASVGDDGKLKLWDIYSGNELRAYPEQNSRIFSVAFSPDGKKVVTGNARGELILWWAEVDVQ